MATTSINCTNCGKDNHSEAKFCQQCGTKLTQLCRQCRAENPLAAIHCKSCGTQLSEAKRGISQQRANSWIDHFEKFQGFAELWKIGGHAEGVVKERKRILSEIAPNLPDIGHMAFCVPIASQNWCVKVVNWNTNLISNGEFVITEIAIATCDFSARKFYMAYHENIQRIRLDKDTITLEYADMTVKFTLTVPRPSGWRVGLQAFDILASAASGGTPSDHVAQSDRLTKQGKELKQRFDDANKYVEDVYNLFAEIIS